MRVDPLAISDRITLVCERLPDGKIKVTSTSLTEEKVILPDQVLEVRNMGGRLRVARKPREYDDHDVKVEPYDPYGPGTVKGEDDFE